MRFDPQSNYIPGVERPRDAGRDGGSGATLAMVAVIGFVVLLAAAAVYAWKWQLDGSAPLVAPLVTPVADAVASAEAQAEAAKTQELIAWATTPDPIVLAAPGPHDVAGPFPQEDFDRGRSLMSMGRPGDAVPHFLAVVEADPAHADAHYRLGVAYLLSGQIHAAREEQRALEQLDPNLSSLLANLVP